MVLIFSMSTILAPPPFGALCGRTNRTAQAALPLLRYGCLPMSMKVGSMLAAIC